MQNGGDNMWGFKTNESSKKDINLLRDELASCFSRISKLNTQVQLLETNVEAQGLKLDTLRGNFSRKLKGLKEEEISEEKKTETIKSDEYIAFG